MQVLVKRLLVSLSFFSLALLGAASAQTAAGTQIQNQAFAAYVDSADNTQTASSEIVTTIVKSVFDFEITPNGSLLAPGQTESVIRGEAASFGYTVINNGNDTDTINLTFAQDDSDGFNFENVLFYRDANGNGLADAGEELLTSLTLAQGASVQVVVVGTVPAAKPNNALGNLNLVGTSVNDDSLVDNDNWARGGL